MASLERKIHALLCWTVELVGSDYDRCKLFDVLKYDEGFTLDLNSTPFEKALNGGEWGTALGGFGTEIVYRAPDIHRLFGTIKWGRDNSIDMKCFMNGFGSFTLNRGVDPDQADELLIARLLTARMGLGTVRGIRKSDIVEVCKLRAFIEYLIVICAQEKLELKECGFGAVRSKVQVLVCVDGDKLELNVN